MKAQLLTHQGAIEDSPLEYRDVGAREPGPGEVRIRIEACGVCRTDLHIAEGDLPIHRSPLIPGHQVVGRVDRVGADVADLRVGDAVGVTWLYSSCGQCDYCRREQENLCDSARFTGYDADGGYAESMVVSEAYAHRLPGELGTLQSAPLLCAGVIGYRSLRLSGIDRGQRLGLFGFGASAHVTIQVARHWGCEVFAFTRSEEHRRHARSLGAVWAGGIEDSPPAPMDAIITFAPSGAVIPSALRALRKGGTLAINAVHMSAIPELQYEWLYHERVIRSVANCTRRDARELLKLAAEIPIHSDVEVFPLKEANAALQRLKRSEIRGAAVFAIGE